MGWGSGISKISEDRASLPAGPMFELPIDQFDPKWFLIRHLPRFEKLT